MIAPCRILHAGKPYTTLTEPHNIEALIIRTAFGVYYYNYNKEPPKPYSSYYGPYISPVNSEKGLSDLRGV